MKYVSAKEVSNNFSLVVDKVQKEPIAIENENGNTAVIISSSDYERYERIVRNNVKDFKNFCNKMRNEAISKGLTAEKLRDILDDNGPK